MQPHRPSRSTVSDAELITSPHPDPSDFAELYARHVADVHVWLSRRLAWAASDLTAETFARALLNRDGFRNDRDGCALPWLLGIARNVLLETIRADRLETRARERLGLPLDLAAEDGFTDVEERLSPRTALLGSVDALPPGEREALELRVIGELTYDEVADQLDIRPTAARLRVSRALRRLAHIVPQEKA
jgi:RNA polymerase sigma factor (sigma-70 family)